MYFLIRNYKTKLFLYSLTPSRASVANSVNGGTGTYVKIARQGPLKLSIVRLQANVLPCITYMAICGEQYITISAYLT